MDSITLLRIASEPTKHGILARLREREHNVSELVGALADEQSNVSHHLQVLRDAGLVAARREGRKQVYRIADPEVGRLLDDVARLAARLDQAAFTAKLGLPVATMFRGEGDAWLG